MSQPVEGEGTSESVEGTAAKRNREEEKEDAGNEQKKVRFSDEIQVFEFEGEESKERVTNIF